MRSLLIVLLVVLASGCVNSNVKPEVINAMAYCNAGVSSELGATIKAKVEANGGEFTAKVGDELKGEFLSKSNVTEANAVALHKQYVDCMDKTIEGYRAREKQAKVDECVTQLRCELDQLDSVCRCRTTIQSVSAELKVSGDISSKKISSECYSGGDSMSKCWGGADMVSGRSRCETLLVSSNTPIPKAAPGTCLAK